MKDDHLIELEPTPYEETTADTALDPVRDAKRIQERNADILVLEEAMPDLRHNLLTNKIEYGSRTNPTVLKGDDLDILSVKLAVENKIYIPEIRASKAVRYKAKVNSYCPIKRFLMECCYDKSDFPEWDSLGPLFLCQDIGFSTKILQRFLIGAVARAYQPGCSMSWIPIFIGRQGCGKSQLIRELVPEDLYSEITAPLDTLMKEIYRLHVSWIAELPEVDNYFQVRHIENFKNLVTTRIDETRMPYQQLPVSLERRFVLAGTSNRSEFLVDPTGNRRFMPLEIKDGYETPWRDLPQFRKRMWRRAIEEYEKGTPWEITSGEIAQLSSYIQSFAMVDPWESIITDYLDDKEEVGSTQVLIEALDCNAQSIQRKDASRVTSVLTSLGWRRGSTTRVVDGKRKSVRIWRRPENTEATIKLQDF